MKTKSVHISFYDERETNDRSLSLNFKTKKKKNWKRKNEINWKNDLPASSTCLYVVHTIHTCIHTWYLPTIHIWGHSVHYLFLSQKKLAGSFFVFPRTKTSERKRKVRAKKRGNPFSHRTYLPRDVRFFFFLSFFSRRYCILMHRYMYLPTYLILCCKSFLSCCICWVDWGFNWSDILGIVVLWYALFDMSLESLDTYVCMYVKCEV